MKENDMHANDARTMAAQKARPDDQFFKYVFQLVADAASDGLYEVTIMPAIVQFDINTEAWDSICSHLETLDYEVNCGEAENGPYFGVSW